MKAVIMCGGEGTRLRPLTCDTPKPMARLCGRPVLYYIFDVLKKSGISEAVLTLKYLPSEIRDVLEENPYDGMDLSFIEENSPLGTAGSVKNAEKYLGSGDFVVISGDSLCDFDLTGLISFHKEKRAYATIGLHRTEDPREYGTVVTNSDGKIECFIEKPDWSEAVSDTVNTGIYILNPAVFRMIPQGKSFDFASDLFPMLMNNKCPLYGHVLDGYWCDIGDLKTYVTCQNDLLAGKLRFRPQSSRVTGSFTLKEPVYIGKNVTISDGAVIGPNAVIDDGCHVSAGAGVKNSVILQNAYIGKNAQLRGSVICRGASVLEGANVYEGAVIGANSTVGAGASIAGGVKVWPQKRVGNNVRLARDFKWGYEKLCLFDEEGVSGENGIEITPEICSMLGSAVASICGGKVAVADDGSTAARLNKNAVAAGIGICGGEIYDIGNCWESLLAWSAAYVKLDAGIYLGSSKGEMYLRIYGADGLPLTSVIQRKLERAMSSRDFNREEIPGTVVPMYGMGIIYRNWIAAAFPAELQIKFETQAERSDIEETLETVLKAMGGEKCRGIRFRVDKSGKHLSAVTESGTEISRDRMLCLLAAVELESGYDVALPYFAPSAIDAVARKNRRKVLRYGNIPSENADGTRELILCQPQLRDAVAGAVRLSAYLERRMITLDEFNTHVPDFSMVQRDYPSENATNTVIKRLIEEESGCRANGGITVVRDGGIIYARPFRRGGGIRIYAEAGDAETAAELCDGFEKLL